MLIIHFDDAGFPLVLVGVVVVDFFIRLRIEARMNAREVRRAPSRFVRRIREISVGSDLGRMEEMERPAALMRMSGFVACYLNLLLFVRMFSSSLVWVRGREGCAYHCFLELARPGPCFGDVAD